MDKTIKLKFEASAKGLDTVYQEIHKILNSVNLSEKTKKSIAELEVAMPAFMSRVKKTLESEAISFIDLKELDKEFKSVGQMLEKVISNIRTSNLSKVLSEELAKANQALKTAQKEYTDSRGVVRGKMNKLNEQRTSGLARTEENRVFAEQTGGSIEINSQVISSYEDFVRILNEARQASQLTEAQCTKLTAVEQQLANAMTNRANALKEEINNEKATWAARKAAVASAQEELNTQAANAQHNNAITEQERVLVQLLVRALEQLNDARQEQANGIDIAARANKRNVDIQEQNTKVVDKHTAAQTKNTSTLAKAAKQVFTYGTVMGLFKKVYRGAIQTVKELDKALTDMAVVTSMSREDAYKMTGVFRDLANATGQTTTEIAEITTKFLQQGKSFTQAMQLTEAASRAATIAGIDGSRSVDLLTNAMNGFQMAASQATVVTDKFAALAASAATDYEELATALSKVASQANLAGMSMDFTLGLLTKGIETTREAPETIGTALKTVISRMRELTDYGATLEDGTDINRVDAALKNVGVSLMDTNGQFRDLDDVLTELGKKWDTLNTNQQANVAVALAGTRQQSRLIAMMQDFDRTLELVDISANSYGASIAQSADYMGGLTAATTHLSTAYQELVESITDTEVVIDLINTLTGVVNVATDLVSNWQTLVPILVAASLVFGSMLSSKMAMANLEKTQTILEMRKQQKEQEHWSKEEIQAKKQAIIEAKQEVSKAKSLVKEKEELKVKTLQTKQEEKQAILDDKTLIGAQKQAKLTALETKYASELAQCDADIQAANSDLVAAKQLQSEAQQDLLKAQQDNVAYTAQALQLQMAQNSQAGILGGLLNAIMMPLQLFSSLMTTITAVQTVFNGLKSKEIKLHKKNTQEINKEAAAKQTSAAWGMAGAASAIPVAGLVIAGAILATIIGLTIAGIAAASNASNDTTDSIERTRTELNKLQGDLYNLQQAQTNVSKLGDEFDTLSTKIIKSSEEMTRLKEIAQQINDEAGRTIVNTAASFDDQLNQIRGYEGQLDIEKKGKLRELNTALALGYVEADDKQNYLQTAKSDPAFVNSIRSIAMSELDGMAAASVDVRDTVMSMVIDGLDSTLLNGYGLNIDEIAYQFAAGYSGGVEQFITDLDATMQSGDLSDYLTLLDNMSPKLKSIAIESVPMFTAVNTMGRQAAVAFDQIGYSADELNQIFKQVQKNSAILNKDTATNFQTLAASSTNRQELYKQLVQETIEASKEAQAVVNMSDAELERAAQERGSVAEEYKNIKEAEEQAKDALVQAQNELQKVQNDDKASQAEIDAAQQNVDTLSQKYGEAQSKVEEFNDAANNSVATLNELEILLGNIPISQTIEELTKLSSTMERLGKITDLTTLSFKEQIDLLSDYPQLLGAMERGFLTGAEAAAILDEELNKAIENTKSAQSNMELKYSLGTSEIAGSDTWGIYSAMFTEGGEELRNAFVSEAITQDSAFVKQLLQANPDLSPMRAIELAQQIQADAQDYNKQGLVREKLESEGYAAVMSEAEKKAWIEAKDSAGRNRALFNDYDAQLQYLSVGTDEYNRVLAQRNAALDQAISDGEAKLADIERRKNQILTPELAQYVEFIDGVAYVNADATKNLSEEEQKRIGATIGTLNTLAAEYKDVNDQLIKDNEARAQSFIDSQSRILEEEIETLEKRKEAYEQYFDSIDRLDEEHDRAQSLEDITQQLSALAGGSDAATKTKRKELLQQLQDLQAEEEAARKEAAREALITNIDERVEALNTQLDEVNNSLNSILQALTNGTFKMETDADTGEIKLLSKDDAGNWVEHKFAQGGLVDFTGPAWVDGTPNAPEAFLSAIDTKNMRALLDAINYMFGSSSSIKTGDENIGNMQSITIDNINITTNELNNEQDFRNSGRALAEEIAKAMRQRGLNINVKK